MERWKGRKFIDSSDYRHRCSYRCIGKTRWSIRLKKSSLRSSVYLHRAFGSHGGGPPPVPRTGGTQGAWRLTPPREESCPSLASQPRPGWRALQAEEKNLNPHKTIYGFHTQCKKSVPQVAVPLESTDVGAARGSRSGSRCRRAGLCTLPTRSRVLPQRLVRTSAARWPPRLAGSPATRPRHSRGRRGLEWAPMHTRLHV